MAKWRPLEEYTPFARLLVEYMWAQRPPLLPNQFAERAGVRKQAVSTWLTSDATPPPRTAVRLARLMGLPAAEVLAAAGHAAADDPLLDLAGAWDAVLSAARATSDETPEEALPADRPTLARVLAWLAELRPSRTGGAAPQAEAADVSLAPDAAGAAAAPDDDGQGDEQSS